MLEVRGGVIALLVGTVLKGELAVNTIETTESKATRWGMGGIGMSGIMKIVYCIYIYIYLYIYLFIYLFIYLCKSCWNEMKKTWWYEMQREKSTQALTTRRQKPKTAQNRKTQKRAKATEANKSQQKPKPQNPVNTTKNQSEKVIEAIKGQQRENTTTKPMMENPSEC